MPRISNWLRLILVTLTVGGGFTGIVVTIQALLDPQLTGSPALMIIAIVFILLYAFVIASGLALVLGAERIELVKRALAIQIPIIYSPVLTYSFGAGMIASVGIGERGAFLWWRLGSEWRFVIMPMSPFGLGINVVPLVLLLALYWDIARNRKQMEPPPLPEIIV